MKLSLKKLRVALILVALAAVFCGSQSFAADSSSSKTETVKISGTCNYDYAYQVLDLVNKERKAEGLSSLKMDKDLLDAAMQRAAEASVYFSHTRPSGQRFSTVSSKVSGENIAAGQSTPSSVMSSWMSDSGHKGAILGSSYQSIGIGCFTQGGVTYWVQDFGRSAADTVSKPSNATKTFSVTLDPDLFDLHLASEYGGELPIGKSDQVSVYIINDGMYTYTQLEPSSFTFSSSKPSVISINSSGVIKGLKLGTSTITVKSKNGYLSSSGKIEVTKDLTTEITSITNTANGVKIKWTQAQSAAGYYVYRAQSYTGEYKKIKKIKSKSTTSYTDKEVKNNNGVKYTYKIVPYKGSDKGSGASDSIFRLTGTSLSSVKSSKSKQMTVKWQKAYKVTGYSVTKQGYQIQYSTSKNFKKGSQTKTQKVTKISKSSKTLKSLKKGKTYYVRIRTYANVYGTEFYSAWSSKKKVKIK